eukprot:scaffold304_cov80-Skeletonema_menzelii.AAC.12
MSEGGGHSRESVAPWLMELLAFCATEALSEEGLREIIERQGLTPKNNQVGDYEFFFAACDNERITKEIIRCLLEYFPAAAGAIDEDGCTTLHAACFNSNVTLDIIRLLIGAAPASLRNVNKYDIAMPLHALCCNRKVDEAAAIQILKLLIEKYPEAIRHANNGGDLPIHMAAEWRSPEFCRVLIEAYPGSEQMTTDNGRLSLHHACAINSLATVEYLYRQYPDAINHATTNGHYPIHYALMGTRKRDNPAVAVETAQFLLHCDPNVKLQNTPQELSLLHFACNRNYNESNIEAGIQIIKIIFDAHPKAIENNRIVSNFHQFHRQVQAFINREIVYARQAKDRHLMTTPDDNGQLPLHRALQNNVRLGSIKLLVKGNPQSVQSSDSIGSLPLHVACMHHDSTNVIDYLIGLDRSTLDAVDRDGNTALHLACRGARYEVIAMLLEKYDAVSVSRWNAGKKLPIDLLWESDLVHDRESVDYMESVYRLLKAYPETVMRMSTMQSTLAAYTSEPKGKKRKFGHD